MMSGRYWVVLAPCHGRARSLDSALDRIGPQFAMLLPDKHPTSIGLDNKIARCGPMWSTGGRAGAPW
jgi:hypothetical protein